MLYCDILVLQNIWLFQSGKKQKDAPSIHLKTIIEVITAKLSRSKRGLTSLQRFIHPKGIISLRGIIFIKTKYTASK